MALPPLIFRLGALPYDWMTAHRDWQANIAALAKRIPASTNPRIVLDLGCGPGVSTRELAAVLPRDLLVGLDLVGPMLRRAMRSAPSLPWVQGDALALPFRTAVADVITAHSFLYLLPDRDRALAEMRRVLRPGGTLVLMEPTAQSLREALRSIAATLRSSGPHLAFTVACWRIAARSSGAFTQSTLSALLASRGFSDVRVDPTLHGLGLIASARSAAAAQASASTSAGTATLSNGPHQ